MLYSADEQDVSRNGASVVLANIHSHLPALFHSEDAKESVMAMRDCV